MRSLATIQRVESLRAIEGADRIECATVLGWEVVVRKGAFKPGDLCCFFEIDSILPDKPWSEFMRERKFRVRTIKLRKQISQGLVLGVGEIPELGELHDCVPAWSCRDSKRSVGDDVTELLGVTKYDPEAAREATAVAQRQKRYNPVHQWLMRFAWFRAIDRRIWRSELKGWPPWLPHTDEERIQNMTWILRPERNEGMAPFYVTEKLDGQSASYAVVWRTTRLLRRRKSEFVVCSRNLKVPPKRPCTWNTIAKDKDMRARLEHPPFVVGHYMAGKSVAVQGEIVGPGVQGNKYMLFSLRFYVYQVWDISAQRFLPFDEARDFCFAAGLEWVPLLNRGLLTLPEKVPEVVELSRGESTMLRGGQREGIVVRSERTGFRGVQMSFKAINPDFLLRYQDEDDARQEAGEWRQTEQ